MLGSAIRRSLSRFPLNPAAALETGRVGNLKLAVGGATGLSAAALLFPVASVRVARCEADDSEDDRAARMRRGAQYLPSRTAGESVVTKPAFYDPLGINRVMMPDPSRMMETCAGKVVFSALIGVCQRLPWFCHPSQLSDAMHAVQVM